jgi:N12 class adenine-specific DNA methylase
MATTTQRSEVARRALTTLADIDNNGGDPQHTLTDADRETLLALPGWGALNPVIHGDADTAQQLWQPIRQVVGDDGADAVSARVQDSYYTPDGISAVVAEAIEYLGFGGGRILEPAAGTGRMVRALSTTVRASSTVHAVERDPIAARVLQITEAGWHVDHAALQELPVAAASYDLALTNPPFSTNSVGERGFESLPKADLHTYVLAKQVQATRPGGLVAVVAPAALLDDTREHALTWIAKRLRLLSAVRLPVEAFEGEGAHVTTDLIIGRRRCDDDPTYADDPAPLDRPAALATADGEYRTNAVLVEGGERIAGQPTQESGPYGARWAVRADGDWLAQARRMLLEPLADFAYKPLIAGEAISDADAAIAVTDGDGNAVDAPMDAYAIADDSALVQRTLTDAGNLAWRYATPRNDREVSRIQRMIELRRLVYCQLDLESNGPEGEVERARMELYSVYRRFVRDLGAINSTANQRAFRDDPAYPLLQSLEVDYDPGITRPTAKKHGVEARQPTWAEAAILHRRVLRGRSAPPAPTDTHEALAASLATTGRVDVAWMAQTLGMDTDQVIADLDGAIHFDPERQRWVTAEQYLSGDVRYKLETAESMASADPDYAANVEALRAVQPATIPAADIHCPFGATWVPAWIVDAFCEYILETKPRRPARCIAGEWCVDLEPAEFHIEHNRYGCAARGASNIIERGLNARAMTVTYQNSEGKRVTDAEATRDAEHAHEAIAREWQEWLCRDPERREAVVETYNRLFNAMVPRSFDGSFLLNADGRLDGMSEAITPRHRQISAAWRALIADRSLLVDHVVGAGKTCTAIMAAMLGRRLGLVQKPMVVVPNHLIDQWREEAHKLFPAAKVLAAGAKDFKRANRRKLFARIALGDWDLVIVAQSSFAFIEAPATYQTHIVAQERDALKQGLFEAGDDLDPRAQRRLERRAERLELKMRALQEAPRRDQHLTFDQLGVDKLFYDESQACKNLMYATAYHNVTGMGPTEGSQRALDLFAKVQYTEDVQGGPGAVFLTGTPISNSMVELFTLFRFLNYSRLLHQGLGFFDSWARVYAEPTLGYELTVSGNYKLKTRFASFQNVPELLREYQQIADVVLSEDLEGEASWNPPAIRDGGPYEVTVERSDFQAAYMDNLIERAGDLSGKDPSEDNMLLIMNDARKAALDQRLVDPAQSDHPDSKVSACARNVIAEYYQFNSVRGTQLVFCDLSVPLGHSDATDATPSSAVDNAATTREGTDAAADDPDAVTAQSTRFSVYEALRDRLIAAGIPRHEIAFIHDAKTDLQRAKLFEAVNAGRVRVLIASTAKAGAGTNVQARVNAIHDLDCPWRPSDLEQRLGRAIRPGNRLHEADEALRDEVVAGGASLDEAPIGTHFPGVGVYRYGVRYSLDAQMWATQQRKAHFIRQVRRGHITERTLEDVDATPETYASMTAQLSANPLILEHYELSRAINRIEHEKRLYDRRKHEAEDRLGALEGAEAMAERDHQRITADQRGADRSLYIDPDGTHYGSRAAAAERIAGIVGRNQTSTDFLFGRRDMELGTYRGLDLVMRKRRRVSEFVAEGEWLCVMVNATELDHVIERRFAAFDERIDELASAHTRVDQQLDKRQREREAVRADLAAMTGFPRACELEQKRDQLREIERRLHQGDSGQTTASEAQAMIAALPKPDDVDVALSAVEVKRRRGRQRAPSSPARPAIIHLAGPNEHRSRRVRKAERAAQEAASAGQMALPI